jgi:hypothetical protein
MSSDDLSKQSLEQIMALMPNLNASHVWALINYIKDTCYVIIPVWFTLPLVQEISSVKITEEQAKQIIENVNNNDMSYAFGRELVESIMDAYLPDGEPNNDDEEETDDGDSNNDNNIINSMLTYL